MSAKLLSDETLIYLLEKLKKQIPNLDDVEDIARISRGTTAEWDNKIGYIPSKNNIIVYSDYSDESPNIKLGDGMTPVSDLPFLLSNVSEIGKLMHTLTIGKYIFDGTQDVTVDMYEGGVSLANADDTEIERWFGVVTYNDDGEIVENKDVRYLSNSVDFNQMPNSVDYGYAKVVNIDYNVMESTQDEEE